MAVPSHSRNAACLVGIAAGGGEQRVDGPPGPLPRPGVVQQALGVVTGEQNPLAVLGELLGFGVSTELAVSNARPEDRGQRLEPVALMGDQLFSYRPLLVVELGGRRHEDAAA